MINLDSIKMRLIQLIGFILFWFSSTHIFQIRDISPTAILDAWGYWMLDGYVYDLGYSLARLTLGMSAGFLLGLALGVVSESSRALKFLFSPVLNALRFLPPVAMIPFVITVWGIGEFAKVFSVMIATALVIWIAFASTFDNLRFRFQRLRRSFNLTSHDTFSLLFIPSLLEIILPTLRVAGGVGVVMVYVSELGGARYGIGYQLSAAYLAYDIPRMMVALLTLLLIGFTIDSFLLWAIKTLTPWSQAL